MSAAKHVSTTAQATSRRSLLAQSGAVALAAGVSGAAVATALAQEPALDAALLELDRAAERFHSFAGLDGLDDDDPAYGDSADSWVEAMEEMAGLPAHSLAGIFVKVKWCLRDQFQGESATAWDMAQGLLADLARLTGQPVPKIDSAAEDAADA